MHSPLMNPLTSRPTQVQPTLPLALFLTLGTVWLLLGAPTAPAQTPVAPAAPDPSAARRIVFLGDSITYGGDFVDFFETWLRLAHPESRTEILNLGLPSETASGLSEPGHAGGSFPRPDVHERLSRVLNQTRPDLVVASYGMNDGIYHPYDEERAGRFQQGLRRLHDKVVATGARIVHLTPSPFDPTRLGGRTLPAGQPAYPQPFEGYDDVLHRYSEWLLARKAEGWEVVDLHGPMARFLTESRSSDPAFHLAGDGVHPTAQGHWIMAREILRHFSADPSIVEAPTADGLLGWHPRARAVLRLVQTRQRLLKDAWLTQTGHQRPGMTRGKPVEDATREAHGMEPALQALTTPPFPGRRSDWFGFERYDFTVDGRPVLVIRPRLEAPGRPWVWHGEFFGHKPNPDIALLGRGFHVVYLSVPDMLGSPKAVAHWDALYAELTGRYGFHPKPALVGLSRGGLYCYNWATAHPGQVACIYGDAPVCDFKSWPGGRGKGPGSTRDWQLVLQQYGFASEQEALAYPGNPIDRLAPLAAAHVPLLHVFGDADEVVPWEENTGLLADRYQALGGSITLIRKPGVRHHPHGLDDSTPIVDFLWRHAGPAGTPDPGPRDEDRRPLVRKLGTLDLDMVETTPIVFQGRLLRFEWVRDNYWNNPGQTNHFRFVDTATGKPGEPFALGYEFGSAFVDGDTVCVTGTRHRGQVDLFTSRDLQTWETHPVVPAGRYGIFNTSLCRTGEDYVLMFEIDKPAEEAGKAFTARFTRSKDLRTWTLTPPECQYSRDRYTAPHALRWLDGWFYDFYLEAHQGYELRVVRSRDLIHWDPSPLNPVLRASPTDRRIANPNLSPTQRRRIAGAVDLNNSDIDFCPWQGQLRITYSWGNQLGVEHLAEAVYDGSEAQFLQAWFPE